MNTEQRHNRLEHPPTGAYIELTSLINCRFAAKDLKLQQRRKALSILAGPNKTRFRGRGLDFEEVRAYQPGDDIRSIDWRVTARTGKAYTKLFSEERERPLLIVTDQRQPMFFGSQHCFKSVMACHLSTLIAWSGLQQGDRVGGLIFGNEQHTELRPRRSRQSVLGYIHQLQQYNLQLSRDTGLQVDHSKQLANTLSELRRIAKPGSAIYIISDFAGFDDEEVQQHLYQLSRHCEITALFVYDPLERDLPSAGQYTVTDGQQRRHIDTSTHTLRQTYAERFNEQLQSLHQELAKTSIPLIEVGTYQPPLKRLMEFYGRRR